MSLKSRIENAKLKAKQQLDAGINFANEEAKKLNKPKVEVEPSKNIIIFVAVVLVIVIFIKPIRKIFS